jgi:hypothetical protein
MQHFIIFDGEGMTQQRGCDMIPVLAFRGCEAALPIYACSGNYQRPGRAINNTARTPKMEIAMISII